MDNHIEQIKPLFRKFPAVVLVYLFGSRARGHEGPMSDYDIAVYLDSEDPKERFRIRTALMDELGRALKSDAVDVVVLNDAKGSELKYAIIAEGTLVYEREPFRALVEPRVLNEYFDFRATLAQSGLVTAVT